MQFDRNGCPIINDEPIEDLAGLKDVSDALDWLEGE